MLACLLAAGISGCATDGQYEPRSPAVAPPPVRETPPPMAPPARLPPAALPRPPPVPPPVPPVYPNEREGRASLNRLLPANIGDRAGWTTDILAALTALRIPALPENLCAAIAVIEQESSFVADPPVAGLSRIVWQEIDRRREKYGIPRGVLELALRKSSPDGRSYHARIDALHTEKQMNALYNDMLSELPGGKTLFTGYNPVRTGGPMQVSVAFAEEQIRHRPYPYARPDSVRNEVFTRRGGVFFGIAMLLDYPSNYSQMLYRFADFNAGRYSSRNAAFQDAVSRLSGQTLALDGDLLRYQDDVPAGDSSETQRAIFLLRARLRLNETEILRDLKLEKSPAFEHSVLYQRLYALADATSGAPRPRERLPQIELKSPKITRQLTTEWFARRVDERYRTCLARRPAEA
jgi:hypothetical protein